LKEGNDKKVAIFVRKAWQRRKGILRDIIFWAILFFYYLSTTWASYDHKLLVKTGLQILLTYVLVYLLIPHLLGKSRKFFFLLGGLLSVYLTYISYTVYRHFYFDVRYPGVNRAFNFQERILDLNFFFTELSWFLFPAAILLALKYYRDQKEVMNLREQKRITELKLLKNQLNPHFLFNTLNNLYTLALIKSDKTAELIGKLSAILDYMLHHSNERFVMLMDEIHLMNNYIDLEKVRYGERVAIDFDYKIEKGIEIAPLILLTFLENAFKHGVKEEIKNATIQMNLRANREEIFFEIKNSKPLAKKGNGKERNNSIGLQNIRTQLDLLYPRRNWLQVEDLDTTYCVTLTLKQHEV
jgi:sensor histidine kinase YesM